MARSLNRVQLIGNLTRDPELRYTPSGAAVTSFGLATNRTWTTDTGEKHDEPEFHNIVAWNKLAELCSQFLAKGRKVYVEGRLATRSWTAQDGVAKSRTEVVIDEMILLDNKGAGAADQADTTEGESPSTSSGSRPVAKPKADSSASSEQEKAKSQKVEEPTGDDVPPDDIPF